MRRAAAAVALSVLACGCLLTLLSGPAVAHAALLATSPGDGEQLTRAPAKLTLRFDDDMAELGTAVQVTGPSGVVSVGAPQVRGVSITQDLDPGAGPGTYVVVWRATSKDGHPVSGRFRYQVTSPPESAATPSASASTAGPGPAAAASTPALAGSVGQPVAAAGESATGWGTGVLLLLVVAAVIGGLAVAGLGIVRRLARRRSGGG